MLGVLDGLGISTRADETTATIEVDGCGGHLPGAGAHVDANQSGTTARFAVPLAALGEVPVVVDAHPQMRGRPMGDQFAALRSMGVTITELGEPDRLPARITARSTGLRHRCRAIRQASSSPAFCSPVGRRRCG